MDYRSKNSSKSSGSHSLDRQQSQRSGNNGERQHFSGSSLERLHRHRTGNIFDQQYVGANSLERHHRSRVDNSADRQHVGSSSLERLFRSRVANNVDLLQGNNSIVHQHGSGNSLEQQHSNRTSSSGDQLQGPLIRPGCTVMDGDQRHSPKHGKQSPKKQKQSVTEKKVEELSRQLEEEKQSSRRTITRLQRDLARLKSERAHNQRDGREGVMKELDRERMLRVDTEQRLHEMREESDSCRARLHALQEEFRKMEDMVRDMLQYKTKIDQLKQEKANLAVTYESNVQKCRNHISTLERENMMLLNQVKKMESQLHGKGDDRDKSRLLLERLKMVEGENSSLVLENEQQRQQYEKCLDQIANQVVQALLAQKTLREECLKLQNRVHDLEMQNRQLNMMFQQRVRFPSDPTMQHLPYGGASAYVYQADGGQGEVTSAQFLQGSAVSLQSMFSETMFDDAPGYPQMSTPPPWLRDRLELPLDDEISLSSSTSGSPSSPSQQPHPGHPYSMTSAAAKSSSNASGTSGAVAIPGLKTKIETEFPATNSSPKMKHVNVLERGTRSLERRGAGFHPLICSVGPARGSTGSVRKGKARSSSDTLAMNQLSEQGWQKLEAQVRGHKSAAKQVVSPGQQSTPAEASAEAQRGSPVISSRQSSSPSSEAAGSSVRDSTPNLRKEKAVSQSSEGTKNSPGKTHPRPSHISPLLSKVKLRKKGSNRSRDSSQSPHRPTLRNSMPPAMPFHSQYYYDYSDEDSDSRPVSRVYSCASTVSLNELLDTSGEGDFALDDDFFSDWSSMCLSPQHRLPVPTTSSSLHQSPQGQAASASQGQSSSSSPRSALSSPPSTSLYHKLMSEGLSPLSRRGVEQGVAKRTEREDSGCEVDPSHSDRSESSSQCNNNVGSEALQDAKRRSCETSSVMTVETGAVIQVQGDSGKVPDTAKEQKSNASVKPVHDSSAIVCTVPVASKSVTRVSLPSPQAAVLLEETRSDSEHSPTSESSCAVSLKQAPAVNASMPSSSTSATDRVKPVNSTSSAAPPATVSLSADLVSSAMSHESFGCTPKLKSKPLTAEEKSRVCRPDQLILAPADKTVHGFTSSSSSCSDDKSPFHQALSPEENHVESLKSVGDVNVVEKPSGSSKPKKTPPPVPHKPSAVTYVNTVPLSQGELPSVSAKSSSGISDTGKEVSAGTSDIVNSKNTACVNSFPPETTLTVGFMSVEPQQLDQVARNPDTVRDFVNSLVRDMKERVARHSDWPIANNTANSTTSASSTLSYCKSLDSSFESLRAERSGSKDDGYSTMSSDIHPVALDKYSCMDSVVSKPNVEGPVCIRKTSDSVLEPGQVESPKKRNKSIETSETDSAMETSAHSMDTRNSSHSLSSQVSSSSGENILSPVAKVTRMACFFEDETSKSLGSTTTHPLSVGTPSPLSPPGDCSLGSAESSVYLSPKSSPSSPESESDGSSKQMYASVVSKPSAVFGNSGVPVPELSSPGEVFVTSPVPAAVSSSSSATNSLVSSPAGSVGQRIHDMVQNFQAGLLEKTNSIPVSSLSSLTSKQPQLGASQDPAIQPSEFTSSKDPAQRPSDLKPSLERDKATVRSTICDFRKYEINDPSKLNVSHSSNTECVVRRENVVSWPPRKNSPVCSPASPVLHSQYNPYHCVSWDVPASPLHVIEEKMLDDIPEESGDEWDSLCARSAQERQQQHNCQYPFNGERAISNSNSRPLKKCKSESSLSDKPQTVSLYDEMMSGNWDSGKVLERSASVSEMDYRSRNFSLEDVGLPELNSLHISFDEDEIQEKVAALLRKVTHAEETDSEAEAQKQLNDLWKSLMSQRPASVPEWSPKARVESLKQMCTPSPTSVQRMDNTNPEDWILSFSKADIEKHSSVKPTTKIVITQASSQGKNVTGMDLSQSGLEEEDNRFNLRTAGHTEDDDGESSDGSHKSPSVEQKLFHSEFYSLCLVGSNRSLASSNCSVYQRSREHLNEDVSTGNSPNSFQSRLPHPSYITEGIHSREFDEISNQIASLSRTVDELNRSLNSLNSGESHGSKEDLHHSDGTEDGKGAEASGGAWSNSRQECIEGYHWVEDEFYLTSCGGEVIIGSAALLAEEEGMADYCEGGGGEGGGMFAMEDNDDAIADDAQDDFYCIRMPPQDRRSSGAPPVRPVSGGSETDHILNSLAHFRYNSDGQLSRQPPVSGRGIQQVIGWNMNSSSSHTSLSQSLQTSGTAVLSMDSSGHQVLSSGDVSENMAIGDTNLLADKEHRANLLDSMLPSGAESNDSLSSDIGLDHMMCQRLMGRKGKRDVVRFYSPRHRPPLDLSHFFVHYGKPEQDAVAAFDFLEDISTSESTEHLEMLDSSTRRCQSASQLMSREVVMRQTQIKQQEAESISSNTRPLSESDFKQLCLPVSQEVAVQKGWQDQRYPSYFKYSPLKEHPSKRRTIDTQNGGEGSGGATAASTSTPPARRHKLRRRRKKSELKDKSQSREAAVSCQSETAGSGGKGSSHRVGRGSRGKRGGERLKKEWHDIKIGDPVANTLSLSDSCCDSSSSPSPPSLSYTDLSRF